MTDEEKSREEQRREAHWNPQERWRVIQETITWADAQKTGGRNLRANRLLEQARKLRDLEQDADNAQGSGSPISSVQTLP